MATENGDPIPKCTFIPKKRVTERRIVKINPYDTIRISIYTPEKIEQCTVQYYEVLVNVYYIK